MHRQQISWLQSLLRFTSDIRPAEIRAVLVSFSLVFLLMASYYILRPLRDAMASDWSDAEVSWLWTMTFFFSLAAVTFYTAVISRIRFRYLVITVYSFFALSFFLFYFTAFAVGRPVLLDKAFYVWISVFSLFHVLVFWSLMTDIYNAPQARRLFAFIGAGASVGAISGPSLALLLVSRIGVEQMLLLASLMLLLTIPLTLWLQSLKIGELHHHAEPVTESEYIGGNLMQGFNALLKSPYLLGIGLFILLYTSISSFIYFELKNLLADYDRESRTQIWASMDLIVNLLTVVVAVFATGRIATRFGLTLTLASVPVIIGAGLVALAMAPLVGVVVGIQIVRRAGNYAITRPAREMLFSLVERDTRFKVKPVIDIVVYRGGDMLNAWAFTALTQGFGLSLAAVAGVGALIAALWAVTAYFLGRSYHRIAA